MTDLEPQRQALDAEGALGEVAGDSRQPPPPVAAPEDVARAMVLANAALERGEWTERNRRELHGLMPRLGPAEMSRVCGAPTEAIDDQRMEAPSGLL